MFIIIKEGYEQRLFVLPRMWSPLMLLLYWADLPPHYIPSEMENAVRNLSA